MATTDEIARHYGDSGLLARLEAMLREDGVDPLRPPPEALHRYDQLHHRGLEATEALAAALAPAASEHLLDVGSGIGGPARVIAARHGCRITGIDLTPEFRPVALHLTRLAGLEGRVEFLTGDALAMPFADASFDAAYSMNVAMNIAAKADFVAAIRRVLKPGGRVALAELAQGPAGAPDYPTPWAETAATSFLATPAETEATLRAAGFEILAFRDLTAEVLAANERAKAALASGGRPPARAVELVHGAERMRLMSGNVSRGIAGGRLVPIEALARRR